MRPLTSRVLPSLGGLFARPALGVVVGLLVAAGGAHAGTHTWDVREVFSNADGTIQYVELFEASGGANETGVGNQTLSSNGESFAIGGGSVVAPTSNKSYLIATPAFAALPNAPTPDALIPAGSIPFFSTSGDTVSYGPYDSWTFGTVPTDGVSSLDRASGVGTNTPTNYAGQTGTVDASAAPVPSGSWGLTIVTGLLLCAVAVGTRRGRRVIRIGA